jgi:hypothetical protein
LISAGEPEAQEPCFDRYLLQEEKLLHKSLALTNGSHLLLWSFDLFDHRQTEGFPLAAWRILASVVKPTVALEFCAWSCFGPLDWCGVLGTTG